MQSKKYCIAIFLFFLSFFAFAQDAQSADVGDGVALADLLAEDSEEEKDVIDENSSWKGNAEANQIKQPFAWESAGDVLKYEITIFKADEATDETLEMVYHHETTEEENETCLIYIDPVIPPGYYHCEIKVYNVLGGVEEGLGTFEGFYIRQAHKPEIRNVSYPLFMRSIIYLDDLDNNGIVEVEGRNLYAPAQDENTLIFTDYYLKNERRKIKPKNFISAAPNGRKVVLQFAMRDLAVGEYDMFAQDVSGLHSEDSNGSKLTVKFKKLVDLDVEGGYVFPVALHDSTIYTYMDSRIFPLSMQARVTLVPLKNVWGYLGVGARFTYSRMGVEYDGYSIDGNMESLHLLFVYQLPTLRRRLVLEPHIGAGLTWFNNIQFHFPHDIHSEPLDTFSFSLDIGFAAQYYINKRLYVEAGLDYTLALNADMIFGILSPSVGVGWQF